MTNIVEFPSFTLKEGVAVSDFLHAHEKFNREFVSTQKGYISHKLLIDDDKYFDLVVWESMEDLENAFSVVNENNATIELMSLIDQIGADEDIPLFSVVKSY